jgi:reversibly glycosylated polypeptide/UDP-arabinopyranose mutase
MKTALVIPTIRKDSLGEFFDEWSERVGFSFDEIIVVEDNPEKTFNFNIKHHYSWEEIKKDLGENAWIISKRDSSIRCYGFLLAYRLGADFIFTLDDDCRPSKEKNSNFLKDHLKNLTEKPKWTESIPGQRTRGLPYYNKGTIKNVAMSVGLWEGVPDFDSIQTISGADQNLQLSETYVLGNGQFTPICGMNMAIRRDFIPACYVPLQGEGQPFRRFDDIWMGIIAKKVADHLGFSVTMGKPYIFHARASDPMTNLVKEAPGIKFNEKFWETVEEISLTEKTPVDCMEEIAEGLSIKEDEYGYCKQLGAAIKVWCRIIRANP